MSYRDDRTALETRRQALERELSDIGAHTAQLDALKDRAATLERELAETRRLLAGLGAKEEGARPSLLDGARVASPCSANWDDMVGDERARFCGQCQKNVFNLSAMAREEAEDFLRTRTGAVCVRLYRRTDGTVMTSDCSVGVRRKRRRHLAVIAIGGGAMAAAALGMRSGGSTTMGALAGPPEAHVTMGEMPVAMGLMVEPPAPVVGPAVEPAVVEPAPSFATPPRRVAPATTARGAGPPRR